MAEALACKPMGNEKLNRGDDIAGTMKWHDRIPSQEAHGHRKEWNMG